jgi:Fe2+ or Zn2+ uptake regulation protein
VPLLGIIPALEIIYIIMHTYAHNNSIDLDSALKSHGVQSTPQRRAIWEFYTSLPRGITIAEAIEALQGAGIGQATVYRTTFLLLDIGLLHRIQLASDQVCYVALKSEHSHPLVCKRCRDVVEFDTCDLSVLEKLLNVQTGYEIDGHQLEVYGVCPKCQ